MADKSVLERIRKTQIMDGAVQMIALHGMENVTLEMVAKAAGLSKGGLTYYYSSKDQLFQDSFVHFFTRIFQRSQSTMALYAQPLDKILSYGWLFNDHEEEVVHYGYPMVIACMHLGARQEEYRRLFADWVDNWVDLLSSALQQGVDEGVLTVEDIPGTARAISSIYQGFAMRWFLYRQAHTTEWSRQTCKEAIAKLLGKSIPTTSKAP